MSIDDDDTVVDQPKKIELTILELLGAIDGLCDEKLPKQLVPHWNKIRDYLENITKDNNNGK